ncbi:MAG TPA: hypothetical protein VFU38_10005 [Candidatus Krumholzibacteria bacterium]|nr:hypothetical protein [Candidatus Krumholzibacteria bacterium]
MKRIVAVFLIGVALAACDDSTQDVSTAQGFEESLPDSIMTKGGVTLESYGSQHPYTTQLVSELIGERAVQEELEHQSSLGHTLLVDEALVARGLDEDGRVVELALIPSSGPEAAGVMFFQIGGERFIKKLPNGPRDESEPLENLEGKDTGPRPAFNVGCLSAAVVHYQLCMMDCLMHGTPTFLCRVQCFFSAVWFFFSCVNFTQY